MMGSLLHAILFLVFVRCSYCLQLCTDSRAPLKLMAPLDFCGYNGSSCCSAKDDSAIKKQLESMNVPDAACASLVQSILCADAYEEIDLISKGGNYGWHVYEGPDLFHPHASPGGNTSVSSTNVIFPVMAYPHSALNNSAGSASVTGGYVYRSMSDPCMFGRYVYSDLYAGAMWVGTESPENSRNYSSTMIPFGCLDKSPIPCDTDPGSPLPSLGYIISFGEDNNKDVYMMTSKGVYRVVRPSQCKYSCPKEFTTDNGSAPPGSSSASHNLENLQAMIRRLLFVFLLFLLLLSS